MNSSDRRLAKRRALSESLHRYRICTCTAQPSTSEEYSELVRQVRVSRRCYEPSLALLLELENRSPETTREVEYRCNLCKRSYRSFTQFSIAFWYSPEASLVLPFFPLWKKAPKPQRTPPLRVLYNLGPLIQSSGRESPLPGPSQDT